MNEQAGSGGAEPEVRAEGRASVHMQSESTRSGERARTSETQIRFGQWFRHSRMGQRQSSWWNRRAFVGGISVVAAATLTAAGLLLWNRDDGTEPTLEVAADSSTTTESTTTTRRSTTTTQRSTTTTRPRPPPEVEYFADLTPVDRSDVYQSSVGLGNLSGQTYTRSVMIDPVRNDGGYFEYDLGRSFTRLVGAVGLRDDSSSDTVMVVQIYADDTEILNSTVSLGDVVPIEVPIENALRLRLQVTELNDPFQNNVFAIFADLRAVG